MARPLAQLGQVEELELTEQSKLEQQRLERKRELDRLAKDPESDPVLEVTAARYEWLGRVVNACLERAQRRAASATDRLDRIATHILAFEGNSQVLDQIVVSAHVFNDLSPEFDVVHVNAEFKHRTQVSDHDPAVVGLTP